MVCYGSRPVYSHSVHPHRTMQRTAPCEWGLLVRVQVERLLGHTLCLGESLQSQSFFLGYESFFADFPDTTLFYGLEAAHLGVLMRIRYSCPNAPQRAPRLTHPFLRTSVSPKTALTWAVFQCNDPALRLRRFAGPSPFNEKRHCSTGLTLVSGRVGSSDLAGCPYAGMQDSSGMGT